MARPSDFFPYLTPCDAFLFCFYFYFFLYVLKPLPSGRVRGALPPPRLFHLSWVTSSMAHKHTNERKKEKEPLHKVHRELFFEHMSPGYMLTFSSACMANSSPRSRVW
ncbi:unnamed protein product [Discosporangium mesarthrocarpum]